MKYNTLKLTKQPNTWTDRRGRVYQTIVWIIDKESSVRTSVNTFFEHYDMYVSWTKQMRSSCGMYRKRPVSRAEYFRIYNLERGVTGINHA